MGFFDWVQNRFGPKAAVAAVNEDDIDKTITASLVAGEDESLTMTFDNTVMTYRGKINNLDYESILRDKERHIYK